MDGIKGADYILKQYGYLPANYLTKQEARERGWKNRWGNLRQILPNAAIGGDIYENQNGKLPSAPNRIWYEADINYLGGYRNHDRVLYSNDGLIFATYDHYKTFFEIH